jgi:hypothetical protein
MSDLIEEMVRLRHSREPAYTAREYEVIKGVIALREENLKLKSENAEQQAHINALTNEKLELQYKLIKEKT